MHPSEKLLDVTGGALAQVRRKAVVVDAEMADDERRSSTDIVNVGGVGHERRKRPIQPASRDELPHFVGDTL